MKSTNDRVDAVIEIGLLVFIFLGLFVCVVGTWVAGLNLLETETGLKYGMAIFVLAVNGVLVPALLLITVASEVRDQFKKR